MAHRRRIFIESWDIAYGSPYQVSDEDSTEEAAVLEEDGDQLPFHQTGQGHQTGDHLAFVDGIRRGEAWLYQEDPLTGLTCRGLAGACAFGSAVLSINTDRMEFADCQVQRHVILGSGATGDALRTKGGWTWEPSSTADTEPDAPLKTLQRIMREAEATLAEDLAERGFLTVVDGTLHLVRSRNLSVLGYVKTHHRKLLTSEQHRRIPELGLGERTSLFQLKGDRYSAYLRIAETNPFVSPWSGVVRLEVSQSLGLESARKLIDRGGGLIPQFAGIPHRDPRAPQNLQPIRQLERHLRHLLGDSGQATRAVREAVADLENV